MLLILVYYFIKLSKPEVTYVKSKFDGKEYMVLNLDDKEEATYMLSIINKRISILQDHLLNNIHKYSEYAPYIKQLGKKIKKLSLTENSPNGRYTSYTINKGDEIALCLRSRKTGKLHDINLIMYVVLHELAHVACPEIDHTYLFKKIFVFLIDVATKLKIYINIDYQINPHEYCGLIINENLLKH